MSTILAITACRRDIHFLPRCLASVNSQTIKPEKILLFTSGCSVKNLEQYIEPNIGLISLPDEVSAGSARNTVIDAMFSSSIRGGSQILMFCDVDDQIHPQKCEIVRDVFGYNSLITALVHGYNEDSPVFQLYSKEECNTIYKIKEIERPPRTNLISPIPTGKICHGHVTIKIDAALSNNIRYTNISMGEDGLFCQTWASHNLYVGYIPLSLINYISH